MARDFQDRTFKEVKEWKDKTHVISYYNKDGHYSQIPVKIVKKKK